MPDFKLKRFAAVVALTAALGACSYGPLITTQTVTYNKTYGDAFTKQLLLNVVRASVRHPMRFTRISEVRQDISGTASTNLSTVLNPTQYTTATNANALTTSVNPKFTVLPVESQEFYKGILRQITPDTFKTFYDSGFDRVLLTMLLVSRIDVTSQGGARCKLLNDPLDRDAMRKFAIEVGTIMARSPTLREDPKSSAKVTPIVSIGSASELSGVAAAVSAGLSVKAEGKGVQVRRSGGTEYYLEQGGRPLFTRQDDVPTAQELCDPAAVIRLATAAPTVTLRSVEGVFRYLGDIVQATFRSEDAYVPFACVTKPGGSRTVVSTALQSACGDPLPDGRTMRPRPIFELTTGEGTGDVSVIYRGTRYAAISNEANDFFTMEALTILSQLYYLNLKADTLPGTSTVLIAN